MHHGYTEGLEKATFAGGCFWCMEKPFDSLEGVTATFAGYTGGHTQNPDYGEVCSGKTGHAEAVQVWYDPQQVSYSRLLDIFWRNIDPTTPNRQFADQGSQYRPAIFYHSEEQRQIAEQSKRQLNQSAKFDRPIVVEITAATSFYPAEECHQKYYRKNPQQYNRYRHGSGREPYLNDIWGKESTE